MKSKHLFIVEWIMLIVMLVFSCCAISADISLESSTAAVVLCVAYFIIVHVLLLAAIVVFIAEVFRKDDQGAKTRKMRCIDSKSILKTGLAVLNVEVLAATYLLFSSVVDRHSHWTSFTQYVLYVYVGVDILLLLFGLGIAWKAVEVIKEHRPMRQMVFLHPKTYFIIGFFMFVFAIAFLMNALTHPQAGPIWPLEVAYVIYKIYIFLMCLSFLLSLVTVAINRHKKATP